MASSLSSSSAFRTIAVEHTSVSVRARRGARRMHFPLPKPLHGWRAFAGEVGIIVIGVLIALGAEQIVEAWHWRNEARDFSKAVDHELGLNLGTYDAAIKQRPCVFRRLNELELFLAKSPAGERPLRQR